MSVGIISYGAYIPRVRLQRSSICAANAWFAPGLQALAKGERAIAGWDEDVITMAVEAARDALGTIDRAVVGSVCLASTTHPFADRSNAGVVKEARNLPDATAAFDASGSQRAGTSAMIQAFQAAAGGAPWQLLAAAELRKSRPASESELTYGDAAAAMLIGDGDAIAVPKGFYSTTVDFVDHYRSAGAEVDYGSEGRWIRDEGYVGLIGNALRAGLADFGVKPEAIDHFVVPITAKGVASGLAKRAGIRDAAVMDPLGATVGDSGVAHPILLLCAAFERARAGDMILIVGFGQGVDLLLLEATDAIITRPLRRSIVQKIAAGRPDDNYLRWLFHRGQIALDRGMRAEIDQKQPGTTLWRNRKTVLGLVGGRCRKTGVVQFPKSDISVDSGSDGSHTQEDYPLAEKQARIVTFTADRLTYSPDPPSFYGMIDFDGGGRMMVEFADVQPGDVEVGRAMRMAFRIKAFDEQRHFVKYFWKAVPSDRARDA